ncbi:MAG: CYTH domain-containing protein [Winogradskyella sp.]|nr:CYTH domain-containing protein [Winogradskyella sp.]
MIKQGFLNRDAERTVRVRIKNNKGFLTIKGKSTTNGLTRYEWEKEISLTDAEALFKLCEKGVIKKRRFEVNYEKHLFEIDEFFEDNEGLILAEVELSSEDESFKKPHWLGEEVTGDAKYYNSMLSKNPYKNWK